MKKSIELTAAQRTIAMDRHRFRVLNCGRRFGKTTLAVLEMVAKAVSRQDMHVAYIATTFQQARDIAWKELVKICKPIAEKINESRLEITVKTVDGGKSMIFLRGWEAVETLRGMYYNFIILDEVASMRGFESGWEEVLSPTLLDKGGEAMFISTPKGFNHFYKFYNKENENKDWKSFHYTTYDNTYIKPEEIEKEKAAKTEDTFAQEYLAEFRKMQGLVYKEFNRPQHLYNPREVKYEKVLRICGVDFGYTNPACVLTIDKDSENNYYVVSEWYHAGKTNQEIIDYCKTTGANLFYPDPAEPDRIEEMRRAGLYVRDVNKDIVKGVDAVRELLKQNKLKISTACGNTIAEIEGYVYPDQSEGYNEKEKPVKNDDHAMDALRYPLFMQTMMGDGKAKHFYPNQGTKPGTGTGIIKMAKQFFSNPRQL